MNLPQPKPTTYAADELVALTISLSRNPIYLASFDME